MCRRKEMEKSKLENQVSEDFEQTPRDLTTVRNDEVRFWQGVSLSLAIFVLSLFASLVMALVMLATR
jgi:hypothetical protein